MIQNTGKFAGKTVFVTGGSRGIGLSIALKLARDGANIVIAAKTADPHPKLPGTIYTAAEEGIWTAAMEMLGGSETAKQCRKPEIMADAAYSILSRQPTAEGNTGNFYIDDKVLLDDGITNFDSYAIEPAHPLLPDFFLEEAQSPAEVQKSIEEAGGKPAFRLDTSSGKLESAKKEGAPITGGGDVPAMFSTLKSVINADIVEQIKAVYQFELSGSQPGTWHLDLGSGSGTCGEGPPTAEATCTFQMDSENFVKMFRGDLKPTLAFMGGQLKIKGDMGKAIKLEKLMKQMKEHLHQKAPEAPKESPKTDSPSGGGDVGDVFNKLQTMITPEIVEQVKAVYLFNLSGSAPGTWHLNLGADQAGGCGQGPPPVEANCTMEMDSDNFVKMFRGELKPTAAFMSGKLKIKGDMGKALKLEKLMKQMALGSKL